MAETVSEKIIEYIQRDPEQNIRVQTIENAFPNLTIKAVNQHLRQLVRQSALIHEGYNKYRLNPAYKTVSQKVADMRKQIAERPLKVTVSEDGGAPSAQMTLPVPSPNGNPEVETAKSKSMKLLDILRDLGEPASYRELSDLAGISLGHTTAALAQHVYAGRVKKVENPDREKRGGRFLYAYVSHDKASLQWKKVGDKKTKGRYVLQEPQPQTGLWPSTPTINNTPISSTEPSLRMVRGSKWSEGDAMMLSSIIERMELTRGFTKAEIEFMQHLHKKLPTA